MDPTAALTIIRDTNMPLHDRLEALGHLSSWVQMGGFAPAGVHATRIVQRAIAVAVLCEQYNLLSENDRQVRTIVYELLDSI